MLQSMGVTESDTTERLNNNDLSKYLALEHTSSWGYIIYSLSCFLIHPKAPFYLEWGGGGLKSGGPLKSLFFHLRKGVSHSWQVWWGFVFLGKGPWCLLVGLSVLTSSPPGL